MGHLDPNTTQHQSEPSSFRDSTSAAALSLTKESIVDEQRSEPVGSFSRLRRWAKPLTLLPVLGGLSGFLSENEIQAANVPGHVQSSLDFGNNAWSQLTPAFDDQRAVSARHWNDVQAVMLAADNAAVHEVQHMRETIIEQGISNPAIPARIVHTALYSAQEYIEQLRKNVRENEAKLSQLQEYQAVLSKTNEKDLPAAEEMPQLVRALLVNGNDSLPERYSAIHAVREELERNDAELRAKIDEHGEQVALLAIPYLGKVIVDIEERDGATERRLVPRSGIASLSSEGVERRQYAPPRFEELAAFVIGRCGGEKSLDLVRHEFLLSRPGSDRQVELARVFFHAAGRPEADMFREHSREIAFGKASHSESFGKSLEPLEKYDKELLTPKIKQFSGKAEAEEGLLCQSILFLAKHGDDRALSAVAQWYTARASFSASTPYDGEMLEALACVAKRDDRGFQLALRVGATFPEQFVGSMMKGHLGTADTAELRAGRALCEIFNDRREEARKWLREMSEERAATLLPEGDSLRAARTAGREQALRAMVYLDGSGAFVDVFRTLVENPFAGSRPGNDLTLALNGLGIHRDRDSIALLLRKASDPGLTPRQQELALAAAINADSPDILPDSVRRQAVTGFTPSNLLRYFPKYDPATGQPIDENNLDEALETFVQSDPVRCRINDRYLDWLETSRAHITHERGRAGTPDDLTANDRLEAQLRIEREELGRTGEGFRELRGDPAVRRQVLQPLVDELRLAQSPTNHIDTDRALAIIEVLARAGADQSADILVDLAKNPHHFASAPIGHDDSTTANRRGSELQTLKAKAIEGLGGVVDLQDPHGAGAEVLHTVSRRDSSTIFRDSAFRGLTRLAERFDEAIANAKSDEERAALIETRREHGRQAAGHFAHHAQGLDSTGQIRLRALDRNFQYARLADQLGGTLELVQLADIEAQKSPEVFRPNSAEEHSLSLRPDLVRSVMHALIANGRTEEDVRELPLETEERERILDLYRFVDREVYWLGEPGERRYSGEGVDVVVLDAGYVYPVGPARGLAERIVYPVDLPGFHPAQLADFESPHPTAVAATVHEAAPGARIHSYSAWDGLQRVPFRPETAQEPMIRALEHIIERQIRGEVDIDSINYSFHYANRALRVPAFREELLDLMGAYMELASRLDVKHSIAAGNSRGETPQAARYGGLGEINGLGLRFDEARRHEQPDGVFIAGAQDAYAGARLAEFSGSGDPLQPKNDLRVISFDGANVLLPWLEGKWVLVPINGTSFAAPNQQAMMAWAQEAFDKAGISPTMSEWRGLFDRSRVRMPHYEEYEGGSYFHVPTFLREIDAIIDGYPKPEEPSLFAGS